MAALFTRKEESWTPSYIHEARAQAYTSMDSMTTIDSYSVARSATFVCAQCGCAFDSSSSSSSKVVTALNFLGSVVFIRSCC